MQLKKEITINEKYFAIIIILIASIFVCIPLMKSNIDMTYDDGVQHICRLIGTFDGLKSGQSYIFEKFCNGFGYAWNLFYSPITSYLPVLFSFIGFSFASSIKIFMFITVFLSGYFMHLFAKKITKNKYVAIIASIMYIASPYRLTDMYIRNALAELTSFIFIPLVFLGLYNLFDRSKINKKEIYFPLIFGASGLILTHTIITIYTAIFAFIYVIINLVRIIRKNSKDSNNNNIKLSKIIKVLIISVLAIFILTAFYVMPLMEAKDSANYEVFKEGRMEREEVLIAYKLDFYRLLLTKPADDMVYEIGIIIFIGLALTPIAIKKMKKERETFYSTYMFLLISGLVCAFLTLKIFPFEKLPSLLKMIQFTFRLLEFASFFFAIISAFNIGYLCEKFEVKEVLILSVALVLVLIIPFGSRIRTADNYNEQWLIDTVPVDENTKRVHAGCASFEYLPSKAFESLDYIKTRNHEPIILKKYEEINEDDNGKDIQENNEPDKGPISNISKDGLKISFDLARSEEELEVELPYIYYPGYKATIDYVNMDDRVIEEEIKTYETQNGFVGITIPKLQKGQVHVEYTGTETMKTSKLISTIGIAIFILIAIKDIIIKKIKKNKSIKRVNREENMINMN